MVPLEVSLAVIDAELPGLEAWAIRHGCSVTIDHAQPSVRIAGRSVVLEAKLDGYRALPPVWFVTNEAGANLVATVDRSRRPPGVSSSIFHGSGVICAPFSRAAYKQGNAGIHEDWGGPTNWLNAGQGHVQATTLGDMAQVIWMHLSHAGALR